MLPYFPLAQYQFSQHWLIPDKIKPMHAIEPFIICGVRYFDLIGD